MPTTIETFYPVDINNVAAKFKSGTTSLDFGCTGVLSGETEMRTISAKCGGVTLEEISKPVKMTVNITAYVKMEVYRKFFGLSNKNLKPGVYSYGLGSKGEEFTLTADVVDEFKDLTKVLAFPKTISATGLQFTIDKSQDEVAMMELQCTAMPDGAAQFYYEGFADEIGDEELLKEWRTNFSYDLVKADEDSGENSEEEPTETP